MEIEPVRSETDPQIEAIVKENRSVVFYVRPMAFWLVAVLLWAVLQTVGCSAAEPAAGQARIPEPVRTLVGPGETEAIAQAKRFSGQFLARGHKGSWSTDGHRIVFADSQGLRILDTKTGKISTLVQPGKDPAWSPGAGRYIAYVTGDGRGEALWLVEAAGGQPRRLAEGGAPTWSADGKRLFFYSAGTAKLRSLNADDQAAQVSDILAVSCSYPSLSPDGMRVAYGSGDQLVVASAKTGKSFVSWPLAGAKGCRAGWSPEGKYLAFGGPVGDAPSGLCVLNVEKRQIVRVAEGPFATPAWSADGSTLAVDLCLPSGCEVWSISTRDFETLPPWALATDRSSVPQAMGALIGPLHRPMGKLVFVDLQSQANRNCADSTGGVAGNDLKDLPPGEQTLAGVKFQIGPSVLQLGGTRLSAAPAKIEGLRVHRRVIHLYILHGTQFASTVHEVSEGMKIGQYRVHYADGDEATIPIVKGEDVRDWWSYELGKRVTRGQVVWVGRNAAVSRRNDYIRLYLAVWENPHPEKTVASVDYISAMTPAAPFCVAMTTEGPRQCGPAPAVSPTRPGP